MSVESAYERRRKIIAELEFTGFVAAKEAVKFGNTLDMMLATKLRGYRMDQAIGSTETSLAVTLDYTGPAALKLTFVELDGQNAASYIISVANMLVERYNREFHTHIKLKSNTVRRKPQPQFIELPYIPKTSTIPSIGG